MLKPFQIIEKILYIIRNSFWSYPDFFTEENSIRSTSASLYNYAIPYSHFILALIIFLSGYIFLFDNNTKKIVRADSRKITEAVVMGTDETGRVQKINRVNPLLPTNIQLEKDITELIYEPLVKYEFLQGEDGVWKPQISEYLAKSVVLIQPGADYQFDLRSDVKWHDGSDFNADDVIATFDLVSSFPESSANAYIKAIKQLKWEKVDSYTVRICTKSTGNENSCSEVKNKPIFSNFLELISIKIVPKNRIKDINTANFNSSIPELYRSPVGTGKYKFETVDDFSVSLVANEDYYKNIDNLEVERIQFKYYKTLEDAIGALQSGEVHALATTSVENLNSLKEYAQINRNLSPVLYNQYWALYFNMKKDNNGKYIGPEFLGDVKVRSAISSAINRSEIIANSLQGVGEEAFGPINSKSEFYNPQAKWFTYNEQKAVQLLEEAGWTLKRGEKIRTNDKGEELAFSLYFVNTFDRYNIAKTIQKDLEQIGVKAVIDRRQQPGQDPSGSDGWSLDELSNQILAPRLFDVVLYGVSTFIDPDRYELFHSTQTEHPKLNISSYVGTAETVKPRENRQEGESSLVRLPKVDRLLEQARSFDPVAAIEERKKDYAELQLLIAEDSPVAFLYHPQFVYYTHNALKEVNLHNVSSIEDRFKNINSWKFE